MPDRLKRIQLDLLTLEREAVEVLKRAPALRTLGWAELEARLTLLEAVRLLVEAELARQPA